MFSLLSRLPFYMSFRLFGQPKLLPFSLVISVCYRCNSRCRTCNVWQKETEEMSAAEWEQVFARLGRVPFYLTFTGGEPFLRQDLAEIVISACHHSRPGVVTIPTNGLLYERIPEQVESILQSAPRTQIGINLSLDGLSAQHDEIRGVPGSYERALKTYDALRRLRYPNLTVSIHTVISRFNVVDLPAIYEGLMALEPDSYITEVAEEREELGTIGAEITPSPEEYERAAAFLRDRLRERKFKGLARTTQAFRLRYYALAARILRERRQVIPCYAGWASGHIAPNGDVWTCCIRAEPIGNLRDTGYDLRPIWFGKKAEALRKSIRAGACHCPMANASYPNMLLHPPTLVAVAWRAMFVR